MTRYRYQIHPAPRGSTELEDRLNFFGATGRRVVQVITTSSYWWLIVETPHDTGEQT